MGDRFRRRQIHPQSTVTMIDFLLCSILVATIAPSDEVSFDAEVIPLLTKMGCNAGACHGAAAGRGEFHLSLLGSDPDADHWAIARQFQGRRVNQTRPVDSLLLRKPTSDLAHGGGLVFDSDSPAAHLLLQWIQAGAPRAPAQRLSRLSVTPQQHVCSTLPWEVEVQVKASLNEAPAIDVTDRVTFVTTDPTAVQIDPRVDGHGKQKFILRAHRRGQHVVLVRYMDQVVPIQISVPLTEQIFDSQLEIDTHYIDQHVWRKLHELRIPVAPPADEATWLRRVHLDLTGRLPSPETVMFYLRSTNPGKREQMVDQLLSTSAFVDYWAWKLSRLLHMRSFPNEPQPLKVYQGWLRQQLETDVGMDEIARQLLTTDGDSHVEGAANFSRMVPDARAQAEMVGQFFAGIRLGCANCHDHPLDRWTQDDYHGLAAVFAKISRGRQVGFTTRGEVTNLRTNQVAVPRIPGQRFLDTEGDHRSTVVAWLLDPQDDYLARVTVNRLWEGMFGRGIVEPVDDLRSTNPATHPELLSELAGDFAANGYRIRHTLRQLALTDTYARSAVIVEGNQSDDRFYSRAYLRPLPPEVLIDAVSDVTGVAESFPRHGVDRAIRVIDGALPAGSLDALGRCSRPDGCRDSGAITLGLPAQLHLINGEIINRKLREPSGRLSKMIADGVPVREIVRQLILLALSREATEQELNEWESVLLVEGALEQRRRLEDFFWSLLNSRSFTER